MKKNSTFLLFCLLAAGSFAQDTIFFEDFTGYIDTSGTYTVPAGWTINSNGSYTTSFVTSNSGQPAYKFDSSNDSITSPAFAGADTLQFWLKGASTNDTSAFIILESADEINWDTLANFDSLPTLSTYKIFPVKNTSIRLRFRYIKSAGNLAFDDVLLTGPEAITADFSAPDVCLGDSSCFTDASSSNLGTIISWAWDFGDGGTGSSQNPCHFYSAPGSYTVQLMVINSNSDTDLVSKTINVGAYPAASFTPSNAAGCAPQTFNYTNSSTISSGTIATSNWDFGNGITAATDTSVSFSNAGIYNITLVVNSDLGCSDTATGSVNIYSLPLIDTSSATVVSPNCGANDGSVTGISVSGNTPFTYAWTPGVQSTVDLLNAAAGTYQLSVNDANNCSASVSFILVNIGAPSVSLMSSSDSVCSGDSVVFTASPSGLDSYNFFINGVSVQDGSANIFTGSTLSDSDTVSVVATDGGCASPLSNSIVISVNAVADATINQTGPFCTADDMVFLTAAETGGIWSGSGIVDTITGQFDPALAGDGTHLISYTINGNCGDMDTVLIVVMQSPNAAINSVNSFCATDSAVILTAAEGGGIWSGSGITDSSAGIFDPAVASAGTHQVFYTISGVCGDLDSATIIVNANPVAGFTFEGFFCASVQFTDSSAGNPISWFWNFGDSTTSTQQNPMHYFFFNVYFSVSLTVTDTNGCSNIFVNDSVIDFCGNIGENDFSESIIISPIPSNGNFIIRPSEIQRQEYEIKIYNILGELIYRSIEKNQSAEIDLRAQPEGSYYITIQLEGATITRKILIASK